MFEVGFSEIILIAIVALLVVGPQEFPALVRNIGSWLGKARQVMNAVKSEFDREINKADEIKRLMAREAEIAELHENLDPHRRAAPAAHDKASGGGETVAPSLSAEDTQASSSKQDHGTPRA